MATVSMSWSRKLGTALLCAAMFGQGAARAADTAPCQAKPATALKYVEVYDGPPEELASLMPDEERNDSGTFTLGDIYKDGRFVTIRCKYADGTTADVKLATKVESCKYAIGKDKKVSFICR